VTLSYLSAYHEGICGNEDVTPLIPDGVSDRVSNQIHASAALTAGKWSSVPTESETGLPPQNRSGRFRAEITLLPTPGTEPLFLRSPIRSLSPYYLQSTDSV